MVNVFSFCLYGPENPRYYPGLLENIFLSGRHFPDWKVYVYYAPDVTDAMVTHLKACSNVILRETGEHGAINMIHRFYAIDEPGVDLMMVRDADSRIHWKDRWAIRDFLNRPEFVAHTIRDNVEHAAHLMGGLWGIRKSSGLNIRAEYEGYTEDITRGHRNAHDQNFLADVVYPKICPRLLVHYSHSRIFRGEYGIQFPFRWSNDVYCGRIETNYVDLPEPKLHLIDRLPYAGIRVENQPQTVEPQAETAPQRTFVVSKPKTVSLHFLNKR
jgi:hypothetical protein